MDPTELPSPANWDMSPFFSALGADDYRQFGAALDSDLQSLARRAEGLPAIAQGLEPWVALLIDVENIGARVKHLGSYLACLSAANALDEAVRSEFCKLELRHAEIEKLTALLRVRMAEAPAADFDALITSPRLQGASYLLQRQREFGRRSMGPELEALSADLGVTGLTAWARLYDQISGKLMFDLEVENQPTQRLPVARTRSLLESPDARVRRAAFVGANSAWAAHGDTLAACLNGISGTRLTLYRRRGAKHFLDPALFDAGIQRLTLDTMMQVVTEAAPTIQGYLKQKARFLGMEQLGYQDLMAPIGGNGSENLTWDEGVHIVLEAFGAFNTELADFAKQAIDQRWIDYEPRVGKRPGGFCTTSPILGQSRIFMTYSGTPADVLTLAHELGHGFHNWSMRGLRPWACVYPMTLAETASTFCEQVVMDALLERAAGREQQLRLLETRLQDAASFLLNIPMRFWFECSLYEARADGELSVARCQELVLQAQRRAYGDALAADQMDPWFWASKLHFYLSQTSFYNFPYTFGFLFSLGLFARARKEGSQFMPRYRALLRETGSATAEEVAREILGIDLSAPDFWRECTALIAADASAFEALAG